MFFCQHLHRFGSASVHTGELTFHQSVSRLARRVENGNAEEEMELKSGGPTAVAAAHVDTLCTYDSGEAHVGEGNIGG